MNDALGSVQSALILGGGSDIALATARALVRSRCRTVVLAGRDPESFAPAAKELLALGATTVECVEFDALALDTHAAFVASVHERFGDIDLGLVAFGVLGDQDAAEEDAREAVRIVETNYTGAVSILVPLAQTMRRQGHGRIVVLSSVAGERAASRTSSTAPARRGSTRSARASVTASRAAACASSWSAPASCTPR